MGNKKGMAKSKMSSLKQKNIQIYKKGKQGGFKKEASKAKRKVKRQEERKSYNKKMQRLIKEPKPVDNAVCENELTGDDMLEMIDPQDLQSLMTGTSDPTDENLEEVTEPKTVKKELLPIATESGWWERTIDVPAEAKKLDMSSEYVRKEPEKKVKKKFGDLSSEDESSSEEEEEVEGQVKSVSEILAIRARKLHRKKVRLACIATNIVQDSAKVGNLEALVQMHTEINPRTDPTLMKHCLVTLLQVFHRIIPGYTIKEEALKQKVKKDTYLVVRTELAMLRCYRIYLQALEDHIKEYKNSPDNIALKSVAKTAVTCFGDLLSGHPRFNYSANISQTLIPVLNFADEGIRKIALNAIAKTVKMDRSCVITLNIVNKIYKRIMKSKFKVKKEMIEVFLSIRVKDMQNPDAIFIGEKKMNKEVTYNERMIKKLSEEAAAKKSRIQKKKNKKIAKIRNKVSEVKTQAMMTTINENHSKIVEKVFGIYIHILKKKPNSKLMTSVLEGLALYAHLINLEFFSDLLSMMSEFLEKKTLGTRESLYCIQTVFTILSGQGQYLNVDPSRFYKHFYFMLVDMKISDLHLNMPIILRIFSMMILSRKKKVSSAKVLSYAKRISALCMSLNHDEVIPSLVCLKELFTSFTYLEALMDQDPEGCPGVYQPECIDPEYSNAGATAVWELHRLSRHYHPYVKSLASNILSGVALREVNSLNFLIRRNFEELHSDFSISAMKFKPSLVLPAVHLKGKKQKKKLDLSYDYVYKKWVTA